MDVRTAIEQRASVREFRAEPVELRDLREMVRLAGRAPSVNNAQPWRFLAIVNPVLRAQMADAVRIRLDEILPDSPNPAEQAAQQRLREYCTWFGMSPALVAVATRTYEAMLDRALVKWGMSPVEALAMRNYPDTVSLGAAIENLMLAATELGYGSCWLTGPMVAAREIEAILEIQPPWKLGAMIAVGKIDGPTRQSDKKPVDEIFELRG